MYVSAILPMSTSRARRTPEARGGRNRQTMRSANPFIVSCGLWAVTTVLFQYGFWLSQLLSGREAWLAAQVFSLVLPSAIALFGLRYKVIWQKVLPWYWFWCISCSVALLIFGLLMRAWMYAFA